MVVQEKNEGYGMISLVERFKVTELSIIHNLNFLTWTSLKKLLWHPDCLMQGHNKKQFV